VETPRITVLNVGISVTHLETALNEILGWVAHGEKRYVCVTGVHGVMESQQDSALLNIHNQSGLTVPDGMPLVWAGWLYGFKTMDRVYGPDLMLAVCKASQSLGYSHFLYGGDTGVAESLKERLEYWFPGIRVVGTFTPPFRPLSLQEELELATQVAAVKPDLFWVGLSTPKQERFMAHYLPRLDTTVMLGVGAAFDFHTGRLTDSPDWLKRTGLQWLHRLCLEPRRLWKRYLRNNPVFLAKFGQQLLRDKPWRHQ
jgi:N-acetylglucosaminyldiphosphoundecaprenol N-acetyl-beta-D-mannosaminyltransferase